MSQRFEYDVVEVKEKAFTVRGTAPSEKVRALLNQRASQGWQLKNLIGGEVAGAVLGKRDGWMVIFERPTP